MAHALEIEVQIKHNTNIYTNIYKSWMRSTEQKRPATTWRVDEGAAERRSGGAEELRSWRIWMRRRRRWRRWIVAY
jgi:hypothetical protein